MAPGNPDFIAGPREPTWGCPVCGTDGNYGCRIRCRTCGKNMPEALRVNANRRAKEQQQKNKDKAKDKDGDEPKDAPWKKNGKGAGDGKKQTYAEVLAENALLKRLKTPGRGETVPPGGPPPGTGGNKLPSIPDPTAAGRKKIQEELDKLRGMDFPEDHPEVIKRMQELAKLRAVRPTQILQREHNAKQTKLAERTRNLQDNIAAENEQLAELCKSRDKAVEELEEAKKEQEELDKARIGLAAAPAVTAEENLVWIGIKDYVAAFKPPDGAVARKAYDGLMQFVQASIVEVVPVPEVKAGTGGEKGNDVEMEDDGDGGQRPKRVKKGTTEEAAAAAAPSGSGSTGADAQAEATSKKNRFKAALAAAGLDASAANGLSDANLEAGVAALDDDV